jgi:hypothetical protein
LTFVDRHATKSEEEQQVAARKMQDINEVCLNKIINKFSHPRPMVCFQIPKKELDMTQVQMIMKEV